MNNRSWDSNDAGHQPAQPPPGQAGPPPWAGPQPQWNPYGQQWAPAPPRKRNTVLIAVLATAAGVVLAGVTVALIMSPDTPADRLNLAPHQGSARTPPDRKPA
jgi:hypothetical protein